MSQKQQQILLILVENWCDAPGILIVGLSGYKQVDTSRSSDNLTRPSVLDKFLSEERRVS